MAEPYRVPKGTTIYLMEFFSGVGSQAMALRDLGVDFVTHLTCEWEVNAIASYKAIHAANDHTNYAEGMTKEQLTEALFELGISGDGKSPMEKETIGRKPLAWLVTTYNNIKATHNLVDITKVHGADLGLVKSKKKKFWTTYSFPCQDLSVAGKQEGMSKGSGTRSGLLWEMERIFRESQMLTGLLPDVLIMENVPQVHGKKNIDDFNSWLQFLESIGYKSFYADLNAKDYGVAQSRNRCYCISVLGDYTYEFPEPFELTRTMEDYLVPDGEVPEEFYVTSDKAHELIDKLVVDDKIPIPAHGPLEEDAQKFLEEDADAWMKKVEDYDLIEKAADAIVRDKDYSLAASVLGVSEYTICNDVLWEGNATTAGEEVLQTLVEKKMVEVMLGVYPT